jgi:hypothetical protein
MEALLFTQSPGPVYQGCKNGLFIGRVVMWSRVQVKVCVGRFSVDFMAQEAIPEEHTSHQHRNGSLKSRLLPTLSHVNLSILTGLVHDLAPLLFLQL